MFRYEDLSILDDAASLIIFLVNRQITFSKEEKQNIKKIIYEFLPDFLFAPRAELSDDEEGTALINIQNKIVGLQYKVSVLIVCHSSL